MSCATLTFTAVVQIVCAEARRMGLVVPAFRSPPRVPGTDRTIRRAPGGPVVAVRLRDRPFSDVAADVIEGVLVANGIPRGRDLRVRQRLLDAIAASLPRAA